MGRVALTSRRRLILLTFEAPLLARFGDFHSPRGISGLSKGEGRERWEEKKKKKKQPQKNTVWLPNLRGHLRAACLARLWLGMYVCTGRGADRAAGMGNIHQHHACCEGGDQTIRGAGKDGCSKPVRTLRASGVRSCQAASSWP